jgi:hypothetical protein
MSPSTQCFIFQSVNMLYDVFQSGSCIDGFVPENLVLDVFGRPMLRANLDKATSTNL